MSKFTWTEYKHSCVVYMLCNGAHAGVYILTTDRSEWALRAIVRGSTRFEEYGVYPTQQAAREAAEFLYLLGEIGIKPLLEK